MKKKSLLATILLLGLFLLPGPACTPQTGETQTPDNPQDPHHPGGDDPFFAVTNYQDEVVFNMDESYWNFYVDTNVEDWGAQSNADWCQVLTSKGNEYENPHISITALAYVQVDENGGYIYSAPRECDVTIKAGNVYEKKVHIAQQGRVYFMLTQDYVWTQSLMNYVLSVSAAGVPKDAPIVTNSYSYTAKADADWLELTRKDNATLRIKPQARAEGAALRSATITLTNIADDYQTISFVVVDSESTSGSDDYDYGDQTDWDD